MNSFAGEIKARIVDARFALSGKIVNVQKHSGDNVKKWDLIASLDRKMLQMELDQQLSNFEKVRADFEGFAKKYPDPQDDNKFTKAEKQASLNASVKEVELAKAKLDQSDLFSPVNGIILDDSGITVGQYITPASSAVSIIDSDSYYFEFEIEQKDLPDFAESKKCKIAVAGIRDEIEGDTQPVISDGKKFTVKIKLSKTNELLLGMKGEVKI